MAPVTEIVAATLKDGVSAESLTSSFEILKQQPGNRAVRVGPVHSKPNQFRLYIDWDSVESHSAFRANAAVYEPHMAAIKPALAAPATVFHAELEPFPPVILDAVKSPVTHLLLGYFGLESDFDFVLAETKKLIPHMQAAGPGGKGATGEFAIGWSQERDVDWKGEPTRVLVCVLGWESPEAYHAAHGSDPWRKAVTEYKTTVGPAHRAHTVVLTTNKVL
ncbi:hypothetical protein F5Y04DRAFT_85630 [Hypomontagnella monticulosa]|nr:hypothetical protein F5Y04DRAFT_85630 [Hypomontagnella monticulosa]